jgi:hypothetical protein
LIGAVSENLTRAVLEVRNGHERLNRYEMPIFTSSDEIRRLQTRLYRDSRDARAMRMVPLWLRDLRVPRMHSIKNANASIPRKVASYFSRRTIPSVPLSSMS